MKKFLIASFLGLLFSTVQATNVVEDRYIDKLSLGGSSSIKKAAKSIYNTNNINTDVLDVAAEVLLQRYPTASKKDIDSLAWLCRAIGSSGNSRYYSALVEVAESDAHRKLRKYAKKALSEIQPSNNQQYTKGTIDISALREANNNRKEKNIKTVKAKVNEQQSAKQSIEVIVEGMSMAEVHDLMGQPTGQETYQTGKSWNPFNFAQKDLARTALLYKGQGRVICSHDGYSSSSRVLEVIIDPQETGYP